MRRVLAMLAMMTAGCDGAEGGAAGATPQPRAAATENELKAGVPAICGEATDGPVPGTDAVAALGRPADEARFTLGEGVTEFRVRLLNRFQLPRDAGVAVLQRTWSEGACRLTIWSVERDGAQVPVEWLRWNEGDEF